MTEPTKGRPGCGLCGRPDVSRRPRHGKKSFRHKCPHGAWCPRGDKLQGAHTNMTNCAPCAAWNRATIEGVFDMIERIGVPLRPLTPHERLLVAAELAAAVYEQRTIAVAEDRARIDEIAPESRVGWTEIRTRWLGTKGNVVTERIFWQPIFEAALQRRSLLGVLRGKELPSAWLARSAPRDMPWTGRVTDANREMLTEGTSLSAGPSPKTSQESTMTTNTTEELPVSTAASKPLPAKARVIAFIPHGAFVEGHGFRVSFVVEGEDGHRPNGTWPYHGQPGEQLPWFWGDDYEQACEIADQHNERLGISKEEASEILRQSMALAARNKAG